MLSKLEVLNIILGNSQLSPVESLDSGDIDAEVAESVLQETLEEVQTQGWSWNTEVMTLTPDTNGHLNLPNNILEADPIDRNKDVIQRGMRMYNRGENTFIFKESLKVRIVLALDFEDLPQVVRRYLSLKASRIFQQRSLGDANMHQFITQEERTAWEMLSASEERVKDNNMITGGPVSSRMQYRIKPRYRS